MSRPYTPRSASVLFGVGMLFVVLAALALATDQPLGVFTLALGSGMGINVATVVMLGEVRRGRST